jgi:transposase-like protein
MKGYATPPEVKARAAQLRDEGWLLREIAEELGVAKSTLHQWFYDADGSKLAARKVGYRGACVDCGSPTNGSAGPGKASTRCTPCHVVYEGERSREWLIDTIRAWADSHGGIPPAAWDWNASAADAVGEHDRARIAREGGWPTTGAVQGAFGSWNAGIEAAGFEPTLPGCYGRAGESPEVCAEICARYDAGESVKSLAAEYGISVNGIYYRINKVRASSVAA